MVTGAVGGGDLLGDTKTAGNAAWLAWEQGGSCARARGLSLPFEAARHEAFEALEAIHYTRSCNTTTSPSPTAATTLLRLIPCRARQVLDPIKAFPPINATRPPGLADRREVG